MKFFLIVGPPGVGKMTVGQELCKKLDYRLFHNHHSIELTLELFDWGDAGFKTVNNGIRQLVFNTVAKSNNLKGFIFTLVWAFDDQRDWDFVDDLKTKFKSNGWEFFIVELFAPLEIRIKRDQTPNRLLHKPSKRNPEASQKGLIGLEGKYQMSTDGQTIKEPNYLFIDNSNLSAEATADLIIDHFQLV